MAVNRGSGVGEGGRPACLCSPRLGLSGLRVVMLAGGLEQ